MQLEQLCKHASARFSSELIDWYVVIGCFGYASHPLVCFLSLSVSSILCPTPLSFLPSLPLVTKASLIQVIRALYWATSLTPFLLRFHRCLAVGYIKTCRLCYRKGGVRPWMSFPPHGEWEGHGQSLELMRASKCDPEDTVGPQRRRLGLPFLLCPVLCPHACWPSFCFQRDKTNSKKQLSKTDSKELPVFHARRLCKFAQLIVPGIPGLYSLGEDIRGEPWERWSCQNSKPPVSITGWLRDWKGRLTAHAWKQWLDLHRAAPAIRAEGAP